MERAAELATYTSGTMTRSERETIKSRARALSRISMGKGSPVYANLRHEDSP
jgi:hypothetical protein